MSTPDQDFGSFDEKPTADGEQSVSDPNLDEQLEVGSDLDDEYQALADVHEEPEKGSA